MAYIDNPDEVGKKDLSTTLADPLPPPSLSPRNSVSALLETVRVGSAQILLIAVVASALVLDGLDVHLLAYVTPFIISEWRIDNATIAPALSAALAGMLIGSPLGGWAGDRFGRKPLLVLSVLFFGLTTIGVYVVKDVLTLTLLRFVSGIGFGAATPNGVALVTEWLPVRVRSRAAGILSASTPIGGLIGASAAFWFLPLYGWRGCFLLCGGATIILAGLMIAWLPESPSQLLRRGRHAKARQELRRIANIPDASPAQPHVDPLATRTGVSIFTRALVRHNIGVPMGLFAMAFLGNALPAWFPTILTSAGLSIADALGGSILYSVFAITGALIATTLMNYIGSRSTLTGSAMLTMALIFIIFIILESGMARHSADVKSMLLLTLGLMGITIGTASATLFAVMSLGYPVDRRSTGIGFGVTAGRLGGVVAILSGGILLSLRAHDLRPFFLLFSSAPLVAIAAAFVIDRHVLRRPRIGNPVRDAECDMV